MCSFNKIVLAPGQIKHDPNVSDEQHMEVAVPVPVEQQLILFVAFFVLHPRRRFGWKWRGGSPETL